ncbi:MAG: hypothetical protein JL50_09995 [Peptococcaceae bacterium BICA1-7]|nr:MAG: hypothetical protein JL50_09995 [Peptococcaceae bacterium BICA1-7]HBV95613.1 hypothetical protein [Desulfotomaculum sp.]
MVARSFATTVIALLFFLISLPGYSLAAGEHAGQDGTPAGSHSQGEAVNHQQHGSGQDEHDQAVSEHSQDSSGHGNQGQDHGDQSQGHGDSGAGEADPAVRNLLVGGFAGINALIIGIALYMKKRLQRGVTG